MRHTLAAAVALFGQWVGDGPVAKSHRRHQLLFANRLTLVSLDLLLLSEREKPGPTSNGTGVT